jgi:hypothetical protein
MVKLSSLTAGTQIASAVGAATAAADEPETNSFDDSTLRAVAG